VLGPAAASPGPGRRPPAELRQPSRAPVQMTGRPRAWTEPGAPRCPATMPWRPSSANTRTVPVSAI